MKRQTTRFGAIWLIASLALLASLAPIGSAAPAAAAAEPPPLAGHTDVLIDVGHGGIDGGTRYGEIGEKDLNLQIAKLTYHALQKKGYAVALNRTGDYALSDDNKWLRSRSRHTRDLAQRAQLANELKPRAVISLHVNWSPKPQKKGPLLLYQRSRGSILLAQLLQKQLNEACGANEQPVPGKTYYLLNRIKAPTVIVEMGFISNAEDRRRLTTPAGQRLLASRIAAGVLEYLTLQ